MATNASFNCVLCGTPTQPKKRVYFKDINQEPLLQMSDLLKRQHPKEKVHNFLRVPVICCKGTCESVMKNLPKCQQQLQDVENTIIQKCSVFLSVLEGNDTPSTPCRMGRSVVTTPERNILAHTVVTTPCYTVSMLLYTNNIYSFTYRYLKRKEDVDLEFYVLQGLCIASLKVLAIETGNHLVIEY